jgi:hypothetical protein
MQVVDISLKKAVKRRAKFYINLFSILYPEVKEKQDKKRLKKNKKKDVGEVISHASYIAKPSNS